jgi:HTH-type transcriptional regulator, cell division transcriptional repressor
VKGTKTQRGHNILGPRIRQARHRLKPEVSQSDLAARLAAQGLDFDRPTITRIESGKRFLRDYEIRALAKVLKVSVSWLFGDD